MDYTREPTLKEFAETFNQYLDDIGCMDNDEGYIGSHKIVGTIRLYNVDPNDDTDFEIVGLEMGQLMGCGCPADIIINIKRVEDE